MNQLTGYKTSRDYKRLAELAKKQSVICIVDHRGKQQVATTTYVQSPCWVISSKGVVYVYGIKKKHFIAQCQAANVEFIEPEEVK